MHWTTGAYNGYWWLISGIIEWGEDVKDVLKREAMEEVGVELGNIKFTGKYYDKIGDIQQKHLYDYHIPVILSVALLLLLVNVMKLDGLNQKKLKN